MRLHNSELNGITNKELQIGQYLDIVSRQTLNQDTEEVLSFEKVAQIALPEHQVLQNARDNTTSLFPADEHKTSQLLLPQ